MRRIFAEEGQDHAIFIRLDVKSNVNERGARYHGGKVHGGEVIGGMNLRRFTKTIYCDLM